MIVPFTVVGLDLSLASTGIARITAGGVSVSRIRSRAPQTERRPAPTRGPNRGKPGKPLPATLKQRADRIALMKLKILKSIEPELVTLVMVEGPSYGSDVGHAHDRSGLWWDVVSELWAQAVPVAEVPPSNLKQYALGKGSGAGTDKYAVEAAVVRRYLDVTISGHDEADALVLAAMGARYLGGPIEKSMPQQNLRALEKITWPDGAYLG